MSRTGEETIATSRLSRRRLIGTTGTALAGATLTSGLSAAVASAAPIPSGGRVVSAQDGSTEYHAAWGWLTLESGGHFNSFVTDAIIPPPTTIYGDLVLAPLGMYYWESDEWLPLLATEWSFIKKGENVAGATPAPNNPEGFDTFEVKLRQGAKWSDDTEITAADLETTMWCFRIMSNTIWEYIDTVEVVDDYTIQFHMTTVSTVVERYIIRTANPRPASVFGPWADEAKALFESGKDMDSPEGRQLLDRFTKFHPENVPASGPYMFDVASISNTTMMMPKNEKCWIAENAKFDRIVNFNGETDQVSLLVLNKDIDYAGHAFAPATELEMINLGIRVLRPPTYSGPALFFNYDALGDAFGNKLARQALAQAVDRSQNGFISLADSGVPVEYMTGMSDNLVAKWMPEAAVTELNTYPFDLEAAAALLQEAGWTKDGDTWKTPAGDDASFELLFPAEYADWSAAGQNLAEQLTSFGIKVEPRAVTYTQQPIDVNKGNFQLAIRGWGSSGNPHPHFSYTQAFFTHNTLAINDGGKGMAFPLVQETEVAGEVDLEELTIQCAQGLDEALQKDQVALIGSVFNELLPVVPLWERFGNNAALEGVRVAAWPADDDPLLKNSFYADGIPTLLIYTGLLEPVV